MKLFRHEHNFPARVAIGGLVLLTALCQNAV